MWANSKELARLDREAGRAFQAEQWPQAGRLFQQAASLANGSLAGRLWFNAGLAYKFAGDWDNAFLTGLEAAKYAKPGNEDPAFWNLGIAATIKRDWATARRCWTSYGLEVAPGEGEINGDYGPCCVRINTQQGQEVVWVRRLCPTRARILSVPLDTHRRFGEVIVHDGAPNGERRVSWGTVPVFDELVLFEESDIETLTATIAAHQEADVEELLQLFGGAGWGIETPADFRMLCSCCDQGTVDQERTVASGSQQVRIAAPRPAALSLLGPVLSIL